MNFYCWYFIVQFRVDIIYSRTSPYTPMMLLSSESKWEEFKDKSCVGGAYFPTERKYTLPTQGLLFIKLGVQGTSQFFQVLKCYNLYELRHSTTGCRLYVVS